MNNYKNENGAALVFTLMIVTLFLIFILAQFTQISSTTKQAKTMRNQIDAQLIAEMGIDYYQSLVESYVHLDSINNADDIELPEPPPTKLDSERSYEISNQYMEILDNKVKITFTSTGIASFNATKTIENNTIIINFESE